MVGNTEKELSLVLKAYDKGMKAGLKQARTELDKFDKAAKKSNKSLGSTAKTAVGAAGGIARLAAAYGAFRGARAAVGVVVDFNQKMAEVSTLTDASSAAIDKLGNNIIGLSAKLPQTAGELAAAEYDIISAGVALKDSDQVLEQSARAAIAGVTDTKTAVEAGVGVMNAYGKGVDDLSAIYDTLFETVKLGVVRFEDLAQNLGKVTPIAHAAGVDFNTLAGAVATLTKGGMQADIATTGLRGAIVALSTPAGAAKKKMDELGVSWKGLEGTIRELADKNLAPQVMRELIPDVRARTAVLALVENYKTLHKTIAEMGNAAGATDEAYKKMADSLGNQFKLLRNQISAAILKSADFKQALSDIAQNAGPAADGVAKLATMMLKVAGNSGTGLAALAAYADAMWKLVPAELDLADAEGAWAEKLAAARQATGLAIKDRKALFDLIKLGVVAYDKESKSFKANAVNLNLYRQGLLKAGTAGRDFVAVEHEVAGATDQVAASSDQAAAAVEKTGEKAKAAAADQRAALQEIVTSSMSAMARLAAAGKSGSAEFLRLQEAMNDATEKLKGLSEAGKQSAEAAGAAAGQAADKWDAVNKRLGLTDEQLKEIKYQTGELKRPIDESAGAWRAASSAGREAGNAFSGAGDAGKLAGIAAADSANWARSKWKELADQLKMTVSDLKKAVADIKKETSEAEWQAWHKRDQGTQFTSLSAPGYFASRYGDPNSMDKETLERTIKIIANQVQSAEGAIDQGGWFREVDQNRILYLRQLRQAESQAKWQQQADTQRNQTLNAIHSDLQMGAGYAAGGRVPGRGAGDTVLSWLTPGEVVLPVPVLRSGRVAEFLAGLDYQLKLPGLDRIPGFAGGGVVPSAGGGETITVNFQFGGKGFAGVFPATVGRELVRELKTSSLVSA